MPTGIYERTEEHKNKIRIGLTGIKRKYALRPYRRKGVYENCLFCGEKKVYVRPSERGIKKYCSNRCKYSMMHIRQKGKLNEALRKLENGGWNKGVKMPPVSKEVIIRRIETLKKNKMIAGYLTPEHRRFRRCKRMDEWKQQVFERDQYTC